MSFIIKLQDKEYNLSEMREDELAQLKYDVEVEIDDIDDQLLAFQQQHENKGYAGKFPWYRAAKRAKAHRGRIVSAINTERGMRNRATPSIPTYFMNAAREFLPEEHFERLLAIALARRDEAEAIPDK